MSPSKVPDRITCLALRLVTPLRNKQLSPDLCTKGDPRVLGRVSPGHDWREEEKTSDDRYGAQELASCSAGE